MGIFFNRRNKHSNSDNLGGDTIASSNEGSTAQKSRVAHGKVLAFLNQKGGVGKTTMAFNTAHALSERGHKVLCLDMDPQANLSLLCGVDTSQIEGPTVHQLLINSVRELRPLHAPALLHDVLIPGEKCDLLPAGQELSGFELSVAGISTPRQLILKKFLEANRLLEQYDYVVIDGPPTLGLLVVNIMCAAHGLLVPFRPDEFSRKGLGHFYDVLDQVEEMGVTQGPAVLAHIPNLVDIRRRQEGDDLNRIKSELEEEFGKGTVVEPFFNRAPLVRSQAEKKSVFDFNAKEFVGLQEQFGGLADRIAAWKDENSSQEASW